MYTLVINSTEGRLQCLLAEGGGSAPLISKVFQEWHVCGQGAELLTPILEKILTSLHIKPKEVQRIAAVRGPGSFTGVRLALATAAGFSRAVNGLQAGIDYLPLLAKGVGMVFKTAGMQGSFVSEKGTLLIWSVTHARRNLVHAQGFEIDLRADMLVPLTVPVTPIFVVEPKSILSTIAESGRRSVCVGSGVVRNETVFQEASVASDRLILIAPDYLAHPLQEVLLSAAGALVYAPRDIEPLYIRESDAEENLRQIAKSLDLDPEEATESLTTLRKNHTIIIS